jgi:hypothetical protein
MWVIKYSTVPVSVHRMNEQAGQPEISKPRAAGEEGENGLSKDVLL